MNASGPTIADPTHYLSFVGALQYPTFTRSDISFTVQYIFLFMYDTHELQLVLLKVSLDLFVVLFNIISSSYVHDFLPQNLHRCLLGWMFHLIGQHLDTLSSWDTILYPRRLNDMLLFLDQSLKTNTKALQTLLQKLVAFPNFFVS